MSPKSESVLVHRLKNQLTIILGFADLLIRDNPDNERCRQDAAEIRKAAAAAIELLTAGAAAYPEGDPFV